MNPNQNLQIPLFHTTYQYHWILIRKRGPYWYDTGKSHTLREGGVEGEGLAASGGRWRVHAVARAGCRIAGAGGKAAVRQWW